jgi:hypothetical protein
MSRPSHASRRFALAVDVNVARCSAATVGGRAAISEAEVAQLIERASSIVARERR